MYAGATPGQQAAVALVDLILQPLADCFYDKLQGDDIEKGLCMPRVTRGISNQDQRRKAEDAWTRANEHEFREDLKECMKRIQAVTTGRAPTTTLSKIIATLEGLPTLVNVEKKLFQQDIRLWYMAVRTEALYTARTPLQRKERAHQLTTNLIEQVTRDREWTRQLHKTPGLREDGTITTLMIDQLVQLLKRLPTHPTLTTIIDRADDLLGKSKLENGDAVYELLPDIEG